MKKFWKLTLVALLALFVVAALTLVACDTNDNGNVTDRHKVTFKADGSIVSVVEFDEGDETLNEPSVPEKPHYTGKWADYSLGEQDIVVNAIYTPIEYTITFDDGTKQTQFTYTIEDQTGVVLPTVTPKDHYTGGWQQYQLQYTNEQVVHAEYKPIEYKITFVGEGQRIEKFYTEATANQIVAPTVPAKQYYTGQWQQFAPQFDDSQVVEAVYTPIEYKITFVGNGQREERTYTVETKDDFTAPQVPAKEHYTAAWQEYELQFDNEQVVNAVYTPIEYTATFDDGTKQTTVTYTAETVNSVGIPQVTPKQYYDGSWQQYEFDFSNEQVVHADYIPIEYKVTFVGNGQREERTYTVETKDEVTAPQVPAKEHYTAAWQEYELQFDDDQVVNAVYTPIEYTATFDDGTKQTAVTYTVENVNSVGVPQVTPKQYYNGSWQQYEFDFSDEQVIHADYIPIEYKVTFVGNGKQEVRTYTVETKDEVTAPQVPVKEHYTGVWQEYELQFAENQIVNAVYTPIEYKITFVGNEQRIERTYNAETTAEFTAPQVPAKEKYFGFDYVGTWEQFDFEFDDNQEVNAVYTLDTPGYTYTLNEDQQSYSLTEVTKDIEEATILPFYNDLPVTSIGVLAFYDNTNLQMVTFEGNSQLNSIGDRAFLNCTKLQNVYYGGTFESLCKIAFENEYANPMIYANHFLMKQGGDWQEVTEIEIPESVTEIGDYQFYKFKISSVTIPGNITKIGRGAFLSCDSLKEITFVENIHLTDIETGAFADCSNLKNVYYGGTIEDWCGITFGDGDANPMCYAVNFFMKQSGDWQKVTGKIEIPESIEKIGNYQFCNFDNLTSITIPSTVTSIGKGAFRDCSNLQSITFASESKLQSIGNSAFNDCGSLTEITIPSTVTSIGDYAFCNCTNLQTVTFEGDSQLQSIGYEAFYGCSKLTSIIIPITVTNIGEYAFYCCNILTIYCEAESEPLGWHTRWNPDNRPVTWDYKNQ